MYKFKGKLHFFKQHKKNVQKTCNENLKKYYIIKHYSTGIHKQKIKEIFNKILAYHLLVLFMFNYMYVPI